jgi:Xaa-Pro aminopeptidase
MNPQPRTPPPAGELRERRRRLLDELPGDALVLVRGATPEPASRRFRQTNELHYLSGLDVPGAYLLLNAGRGQAVAYVPHRSERRERSEGPSLAAEDAAELAEVIGVDSVAGPEQLPLDLAAIAFNSPCPIYVPHAPSERAATSRDGALTAAAWEASDPLCSSPAPEAALIDALHLHFPSCPVRDMSPALDRLRLHKSAYELEQMRTAAHVCGEAVKEAMRSTSPGTYEYELEAIATFIFRQAGAAGGGYEAIIAGGSNAWHGHYNANNAPLHDGDLVLMDYAPDFNYYTSDIGRMWPVNGRYSDWQRELYGFVVAYHHELISRIQAGVTASAVLEGAATAMRRRIEATSFSKPAYRTACEKALEFDGHLSHPVGMAVHDVGRYGRAPLEPGLVFSVDPMIWVPEEHLYIRVEDTVAVTEDGVENLTGFVPLELDDVERLMTEPGLLDHWKGA